jgi:hypothetical protein
MSGRHQGVAMKVRIDRKGAFLKVGFLLGAMGIAPVASAQFEPWVTGRPGEQHLRSRIGMSIQGGGGVVGFMRANENDVTNLGGSWDVRAVFGTRTIPALEAAYVGSSRSVTGGFADGAGLVSNGIEGTFRLNAPFLAGETLIEPFGFVGLGWSHYYLSNFNTIGNTTFVGVRADDVGTVPMGGGIAFGYRGFIAEARFTYRPTWDNDLALSATGGPFELDTWGVTGMIGFEF